MPFFYAIIFTEFLLAKLELIYYRNKNSKTTQLLDSKYVYDFIFPRYDKCSIVDLKLLLAVIIKSAVSSVILIHNHPSGNLKPSEEDRKITQKIVNACKLMDVRFTDHLIISNSGYYSFADNGDV